MAGLRMGWGSILLAVTLVLVVMPGRAAAFGAGNIPSIAQVEGHNWRHGDIEDMLKTLAFIHGKKWTSMLVSRTYFGNWLRDYSQAVDVGSLKGVNAATIRILVWVLSFMAHGYATEEFEVTEERLGVYRPEEHIDNPLGYADGEDARKYDPRLRGPIDPRELEIDPQTGMKNYISNERGGWATSAGYLRYSFARCIHYGRVYTHGSGGSSGKEADLCEALRCLGQALHTMEDFSAHSNYCELALIELGYRDVFAHCGRDTQIHLRGKRVWPLVTGTFGAIDFLHSVLGEATDHFTQSEIDEMNTALKSAEGLTKSTGLVGGGGGSTRANEESSRGLFGIDLPDIKIGGSKFNLGDLGNKLGNLAGGGSSSSGGGGSSGSDDFISSVSKLPGIGGGFASQARDLKEASDRQKQENTRTRAAGDNQNLVPGMSPNFDPVKVAKQIYPILEFRDKIVRAISNMVSKIPGLESLLDHISETLTVFILGLLAPFIQPIINQVSKVLKDGSSGLINSSANQQLEPWTNPRCDNPTHSMLSKDHFTNVLNSCAGRIAATILQYVVPRVVYAWENPGVPVDEVVNDVLRAFHHPAIRDENIQIQRDMFETVRKWTQETPHRNQLNHLLSSDSVKNHKNHILPNGGGSSGTRGPGGSAGGGCHDGGHGRPSGSLWGQLNKSRDFAAMTSSAPSGGYGGAPQPSHSPYGGGGYSAPAPSYQGGGGYGQQYGNPSPNPGYGGYGAPQPPPQQQPSPGGYWQGGPPPPQQYGGGGYQAPGGYPGQQGHGAHPHGGQGGYGGHQQGGWGGGRY
ncbi:Heterokaryon incompatibility Het-C [Rhypophila decipiens]